MGEIKDTILYCKKCKQDTWHIYEIIEEGRSLSKCQKCGKINEIS